MEGPLSKWTNVMQGWQYRWFVLDEQAGLLTYYTSKEKMTKGQRRGCVRLKGAVVGIDDEDESTFTITVDQKMFHFQGRDGDERERWVRALESVIQRHSGYYRTKGKRFMPAVTSGVQDFDRKIQETDAYLQLMIDQIKAVERKIEACDDAAQKESLLRIVETGNAMLESVKHSIVLLQICKNKIWPADGVFVMNNVASSIAVNNAEAPDSSLGVSQTLRELDNRAVSISSETDQQNQSYRTASGQDLGVYERTSVAERLTIPVRSYSTSEDEEDAFFDTVEEYASAGLVGATEELDIDDSFDEDAESAAMESLLLPSDASAAAPVSVLQSQLSVTAEFANDEPGINYDSLYENADEENLDSMEEHGSVIMHLLSQLSIGMDLTKIVLPTFILERRSLLEMYADFFAHPDLFVKVADLETPEERMIQVVKWYLSAFHAGRKSSVAKKPYNPILGEIFQCHWPIPGLPDCLPTEQQMNADFGVQQPPMLNAASPNDLTFLAEQVSHHPPISAFYGEHAAKRLQFDAHIWTKSKFLGLSVAVHMVGQGCISVLDHDEEYLVTFPNGYGRSILTTPWVELGGKCAITCSKTGYNADIEFQTKPFYGGKLHAIKADVFRPGNKQPVLSVKGTWNGVMTKKTPQGEEVFLDVSQLPIMRKVVKPISEQDSFESRRLWRHVTAALAGKDVIKATQAKHWLENRQRTEAKQRVEDGTKWSTKFFQESGENWIYKWPLQQRLRRSSVSSAKT